MTRSRLQQLGPSRCQHQKSPRRAPPRTSQHPAPVPIGHRVGVLALVAQLEQLCDT